MRLELALLGVDEDGLVKLRQEMLSCTVENRAKDLLKLNRRLETGHYRHGQSALAAKYPRLFGFTKEIGPA